MMVHLQVSLAPLEREWYLNDGILFSPHPFKLEYDEIQELILNPVDGPIDVLAA